MTVAPAPHVRRAGLVVTIASLAVIAFETLLPQSAAPPLRSHLCLVCGSLGGVNAVLNVFLFVPLGVGLALSGFRNHRAIIAMCVLAALIEGAQFFVIAGRYSTLGDVLTNTLGGAIGFAIARYARNLLRPSPRISLALSASWITLWLAIQTVSAFGFAPALPTSDYYGQIAPQLGDFEPFIGSVVTAHIADVIVPDTRFPDSRKVRELLRRGAIVTTTIVPAGTARGVAPIVRVADDEHNEILLLAQNAENLVFGVRTGAAVLHLRPPLFALPYAFPVVLAGGNALDRITLTVSARYSTREVWVNAQTNMSNDRRIPISFSLGWTMLLPFQWFIEGNRTELVVSAIWMACLMVPIGYWLVGVVRFRQSPSATRITIVAVLTTVVLLYIGLVVVPHTFGVTGATYIDWLAAFMGILLGAALAVRFFLRNTMRLPPPDYC